MFNKFAIKATQLTGSYIGFMVGMAVAIVTNDKVITFLSFLMLFIIQYSQNKDTAAIHLKLDELIKATKDARNETIGVEEKDIKEIKHLKEPVY